ncbi:MAG: cytochrome c [Gammaproteobacteria bacterium]|nr:cytochrome c [Gammaproteobacteria bacterium]
MRGNTRIGLAGMLFALASFHSAYAGNPFNGKAPYERFCMTCHGERGESKLIGVPNFSRGEVVISSTDPMLMRTIKNGKGVMPGFQGQIKDAEILDIIAYLRTMF